MENLSILTVWVESRDEEVSERALFLASHPNKRIRVRFVKKDGSLRDMVCVPQNQWHEIVGTETTAHGRHIVESKAKRDMVVVTEICNNPASGQVVMQPRTINLRTIVSMDLDS